MNVYTLFSKAPAPLGIETQKAHIIGGGLAGLAAAVFLIDDASMPGENITIYEKRNSLGGCLDAGENERGYVCPAERELEPYMECWWYLLSKIPSLEDLDLSVLDESVRSNKDHPIHSESRLLCNQGHIYEKTHDFSMSPELLRKMINFVSLPESELEDLTIEEYFGRDSGFFESSLWLCFHSMLAFKPYQSALEMQRYCTRFALIPRLDYLEGILHTKRNDKESVVDPLYAWLKDRGVHFRMQTTVEDLDMDEACNTVTTIKIRDQAPVPVSSRDLVFLTNGGLMTNCTFGDNTHTVEVNRDNNDLGLFSIWKHLAARHPKFGNPDKFLGKIDSSHSTKWMSYFLTVENYPAFFERLEKLTGSRSGTGGGITFIDSGWGMSLVIYGRDYYKNQEAKNRDVLWGDGLFGERVGDHIQKPMAECTGEEIIEELLYHFGLLDMKDEVLAHCYISTCMMPYIGAHFMPRKVSDRPKNVPDGCVNLAFLGQYVEIEGDAAFTVETSVRTALEGVYKLTHLDKDYIEVNPARYDLRHTVDNLKKLKHIDGEITRNDLPKIHPIKLLREKNRLIEMLLEKANVLPPYTNPYPGRDKSVSLKESVLNPQFPVNDRPVHLKTK